MKFIPMSLVVLIAMSMNACAIQNTKNQIQPSTPTPAIVKNEFSAEKKQAVLKDWNDFSAFMTQQKDSFHQREVDFLQAHEINVKSKQDSEFLKFRLTNIKQFQQALSDLTLQTQEVDDLKQITLKGVDNQIKLTERLITVGYPQGKSDQQAVALNKELDMMYQDFQGRLNALLKNLK